MLLFILTPIVNFFQWDDAKITLFLLSLTLCRKKIIYKFITIGIKQLIISVL